MVAASRWWGSGSVSRWNESGWRRRGGRVRSRDRRGDDRCRIGDSGDGRGRLVTGNGRGDDGGVSRNRRRDHHCGVVARSRRRVSRRSGVDDRCVRRRRRRGGNDGGAGNSYRLSGRVRGRDVGGGNVVVRRWRRHIGAVAWGRSGRIRRRLRIVSTGMHFGTLWKLNLLGREYRGEE